MTTPDAVITSFQFLIRDYGYVVTRKDYDAQYFGNCIVEFTSEPHVIRIVVDRSQVFVEIRDAQAQAAFCDLWTIMTHLSGHPWSYDFYKPLASQLEELAKLVRLQYAAIVDNQVVHACRNERDQDDLDN